MQKTIEHFLDVMNYERGLAALTREAYGRDLRELQGALPREVTSWAEVTTDHLVSHLTQLRERGFADSSLMRYAAAYKTFFAWLLEENLIPFSPTDAFVSPKKPLRLPRSIEEKTLIELIEQVDGTTGIDLRDRAILEIFYGCGLRCSELIGLNLTALDVTAQTFRVYGKGRKERIVPFGKPARTAIGKYLVWRERWLAGYKKGALAYLLGDPEAPLFLSPTGKRLSRPLLAKIIHARIHAFLPEGSHATPHTLRHAFATHLLNHGAPLLDIRDLLGHASVTTTQIYTHVSDKHLRDTFNACFPRK